MVQSRSPHWISSEMFLKISHINILLPHEDPALTWYINSAEYNKCLLHWNSIHPVRLRALLKEIKKTIDHWIESGMENDIPPY